MLTCDKQGLNINKFFLPFFLLTVGFSMSKEGQKTQVEGEDSNEVNLFKGPVCKNHKTLSKSAFCGGFVAKNSAPQAKSD